MRVEGFQWRRCAMLPQRMNRSRAAACTAKWFHLSAQRLVAAATKLPLLTFAFSFFGIIDLLAVLPFFVATGLDLRSIRAFRFLRLFRAFKMARYSKAIRRFHRAFVIAREEIVLFLVIFLANRCTFNRQPSNCYWAFMTRRICRWSRTNGCWDGLSQIIHFLDWQGRTYSSLLTIKKFCLAAVVEGSKARRYLAYTVDHYQVLWVRLSPSASPQKENWCF